MSYGYTFYFQDGSDVLTFPITPGELSIKIGSNNKVINLINEGDINVLKSPSLVEVEFEARFPMRKYPYSRNAEDFQTYFNKFKALKEEKRSFRFIVTRTTPNNKRLWDTNLLMALEEIEFSESYDEGDDVLVSFKLKQFKDYGVKTLSVASARPNTTSTSNTSRQSVSQTLSNYKVQSGDCLYNIAKAAYGDASKWPAIYNANKDLIEIVAENHGKNSSSNGHWIFPGTELVIPNVNAANLNVTKLSNNSKSYVEDVSDDLFSG